MSMFDVRSLRNKFSDLKTLATFEDFHIIAVSESWINTENRDFLAEYHLPGYSIFTCERQNKKSGGVFFYVKARLNPIVLQTEKIDNVDVTFLQFKTRSKKIIIGLIYRLPAHNNNIDRKLFDQIIEVSNSFESVIFGDFNLPVTSWENSLKSHVSHDLYNNLLESGLSQHVSKLMRDNNMLDFVFSTNDGLVSNVNTGPVIQYQRP